MILHDIYMYSASMSEWWQPVKSGAISRGLYQYKNMSVCVFLTLDNLSENLSASETVH
jgi:hypothetical protein